MVPWGAVSLSAPQPQLREILACKEAMAVALSHFQAFLLGLLGTWARPEDPAEPRWTSKPAQVLRDTNYAT